MRSILPYLFAGIHSQRPDFREFPVDRSEGNPDGLRFQVVNEHKWLPLSVTSPGSKVTGCDTHQVALRAF